MDDIKIPLEWIKDIEKNNSKKILTPEQEKQIDLFIQKYHGKYTLLQITDVLKKNVNENVTFAKVRYRKELLRRSE